MRIHLFLFLLLATVTAYSQDKYYQAFRAHMPTDLGTEIQLPDPGMGEFDLDQFRFSSGSVNIMVIASDIMYHKIFSRYRYNQDSLNNFKGEKTDWKYKMMTACLVDSIPEINFNRYDLVLYSACGYCMELCQHDKGLESCHRNVCEYQKAWFLRDKSQERIGAPEIMKSAVLKIH